MRRPIGYYVHHQGAGHWQRACRIVRELDRPCTLIGTFQDIVTAGAPGAVLDLPDDRLVEGFDGCDGEAGRPEALHYAPLGHAGIRARMAAVAAWVERADPVLMIVDVSVEVALFARLLSVPTLVVRLAGSRIDPPHLEAFRSAERLIAPFPEVLDIAETPAWVRSKTIHAGFLGAAPSLGAQAQEDGRIVVVLGRGGVGGRFVDLASAARAVPGRDWHVLGPVPDAEGAALPPNLHLHGWVEDVASRLAPASLVIGAGGDGVVAAVAAAGKRFICLPEPRPYGEQTTKATALARLGAAVVQEGWPDVGNWPDLVARASALDPAVIGGLADPEAARGLAARIESIAVAIEGRRASTA